MTPRLEEALDFCHFCHPHILSRVNVLEAVQLWGATSSRVTHCFTSSEDFDSQDRFISDLTADFSWNHGDSVETPGLGT